MPDDQLYEGKTIRDIVIGLDKDVKHVLKLLQGNGSMGLIDRMDDVEDVTTVHKTYFMLIGAAIALLAACAIQRLFG